jgi:hypothetical protein
MSIVEKIKGLSIEEIRDLRNLLIDDFGSDLAQLKGYVKDWNISDDFKRLIRKNYDKHFYIIPAKKGYDLLTEAELIKMMPTGFDSASVVIPNDVYVPYLEKYSSSSDEVHCYVEDIRKREATKQPCSSASRVGCVHSIPTCRGESCPSMKSELMTAVLWRMISETEKNLWFVHPTLLAYAKYFAEFPEK